MAKPTEIVTWATDATYTVDGDAWGGDATKVDPGATRRAEGIEPDTFPAEWLNYHLNALGLTAAYFHGVLEESDSIPAATKTLVLSADQLQPDRVGGADNWRATGQAGLISNGTNAPNWVSLSLATILPPGSIITRVRAKVTPGATRATQTDRMSIEVRRMDFDLDAGRHGRVRALGRDRAGRRHHGRSDHEHGHDRDHVGRSGHRGSPGPDLQRLDRR